MVGCLDVYRFLSFIWNVKVLNDALIGVFLALDNIGKGFVDNVQVE